MVAILTVAYFGALNQASEQQHRSQLDPKPFDPDQLLQSWIFMRLGRAGIAIHPHQRYDCRDTRLQMDVHEKLAILADAAKYDATCASSGSKTTRVGSKIGTRRGWAFVTATLPMAVVCLC